MKSIYRLFLLVILMAAPVSSASIYYLENFGAWATFTNNGWDTDYLYGRDGYFTPPTWGGAGENIPSTVDINGGELRIYGCANNGVLAYNNYWVGRTCKFVPENHPVINKQLSASAEHPFGFQVIRTGAIIDPSGQEGDGDDAYHQGTVNVWLIQHQADKTNEWDTLDNFIYFMEHVNHARDFDGDGSGSRLGYYAGSEIFPNLASLQAKSGLTHDFTTYINNYDDTDNGENSYWDPADIENESTDALGIRMTHDGSRLTISLNPNPNNRNGAGPDAWFTLGSVGVGWSSNLAVMIGQENLFHRYESTDAKYDDFLIRTVASNTMGILNPGLEEQNPRLELAAGFAPSDSGIGEVLISASFRSRDEYPIKSVSIGSKSLKLIKGNGNNPSLGSAAMVYTDEGLLLRLCKTSTDENDIIDFNNNKNLLIEFSFDALADGGRDMSVYVNNEKYPDTGPDITSGKGIKYATTGWQKASISIIEVVERKPFTGSDIGLALIK